MEESCGYLVDNVDNLEKSREMAQFRAVDIVDNPVDTVDDSAFGCV